jgi:superoxide reductase
MLSVIGLGNDVTCCNEKMHEIVFKTMDEGKEKHLPLVSRSKSSVYVDVGENEHPMIEEHSINFIYLRTNKGGHLCYLKPGEPPATAFDIRDEEPKVAYAYCNKHGMWEKVLD